MGVRFAWSRATAGESPLRWGVRRWRPREEVHLDRLRRERAGVVTAEILVERGRGRLATVVVGGFVPDASEAVFCQRRLLRRFGPVFYVQYASTGFDGAAIDAQLLDLCRDLSASGRRVVLLGVSFGCGLLADFLDRHGHLTGPLAGVAMVSPVLSLEDLGDAAGEV